MNEQDRAELEQLKQRLALLQDRLPELERFTTELRQTSYQIAALEERLRAQPPAENAAGVRAGPKVGEPPLRLKPAVVPEPAPERSPVGPPPIPPIISPRAPS